MMLAAFTNMLSIWQWGLLAAVPLAIIALYFLKLKRIPLEVPSTILWKRSIDDLQVNSIWQRLRKNILLLLQLLLLAIIMFALVRPSWQSQQLEGGRYIFLIDNSASMNATDVGPTRLEIAKQQAAELIAAMNPGDVAKIITFSNQGHEQQAFTSDRTLLQQRLDAIVPTRRTTDPEEAIKLATSRANPGQIASSENDELVAEAEPAQLFIFSDGRFRRITQTSLGNLYVDQQRKPVYQIVGSEKATNISIAAFQASRNLEQDDRNEVFLLIQNHTEQVAQVTVDLKLNGQYFDSAELTVPAGKSKGTTFYNNLENVDDAVLHAKISKVVTVDGKELKDHLSIDNEAWALINTSRRAKVACITDGNDALRTALSTDRAEQISEIDYYTPKILNDQAFLKRCSIGEYDLVIYDRCLPKVNDDPKKPYLKMPAANCMFIGCVPPDVKKWGKLKKVKGPQVIDIQRAHPIMQWIESLLGDVLFAEAYSLKVPAGGTTLIDCTTGPMCVIAPRDGYEDLVLSAAIVQSGSDGELQYNTTWPLRKSFAVFTYGVLRYLSGQQFEHKSAQGFSQPGQPRVLQATSLSQELVVVLPDQSEKIVKRNQLGKYRYQSEKIVKRNQLGKYRFNETEQLGVYLVKDQDKLLDRFVVNLFDRNESDIRSREKIQIKNIELAGKTSWQPIRKEVWKYLLFGVLAVMLLEWFIYNRRVYL